MIKKTLAIRCNKCYNILTETGECYCKALGFIKDKDNKWFIYSDDEDFSLLEVWLDERGRKVKVVNLDLTLKAYNLLLLSNKIIKYIKPLKEKK